MKMRLLAADKTDLGVEDGAVLKVFHSEGRRDSRALAAAHGQLCVGDRPSQRPLAARLALQSEGPLPPHPFVFWGGGSFPNISARSFPLMTEP